VGVSCYFTSRSVHEEVRRRQDSFSFLCLSAEDVRAVDAKTSQEPQERGDRDRDQSRRPVRFNHMKERDISEESTPHFLVVNVGSRWIASECSRL
jgi:hypothetical protein